MKEKEQEEFRNGLADLGMMPSDGFWYYIPLEICGLEVSWLTRNVVVNYDRGQDIDTVPIRDKIDLGDLKKLIEILNK